MTALQNLERQAQDENAIMRELAEKSSRETSSVRILTIIMLIYLPCTVVSVSTGHTDALWIRTNSLIELLFDTVRQPERD